MRLLYYFCLLLLAAFALTFSLGQAFAVDTPVKDMITEFQQSFKAGNPKARRDLVITAIDTGLIHRGLSSADAKLMFAKDIQFFRRDSQNDNLKAVVFFEPAKPAPHPIMSALQEGWYIDFVFTSDGSLEHYSLSNLHK
jgi:hypothetical protein